MRRFILVLIPGLLLACGDDVVSTGAETNGDTSGTPATDATDGPNSDPTGSPTADPTGSPTVDPTGTASESASDATSVGTTPDPSTTTGPTSESETFSTVGETTTLDTTTLDTTTGDGLCGADGPVIAAELIHVEEPAPGCGTLEFTGQNQANAPGPFYALDGCPCGANCIKPDPWTFSLTAPKGWEAGPLPACPRIVVERQMSKAGCELVGLAIWDSQEPEGAPAVYHAGSLLGPIQAAVGQLATQTIAVEECACDGCCSTPTRFDLKFTALKTELTLAEGQSGPLGTDKLGYEVMNFQSHISGLCDDSPAIDWIARRLGKP